jgi:hypothetical protein
MNHLGSVTFQASMLLLLLSLCFLDHLCSIGIFQKVILFKFILAILFNKVVAVTMAFKNYFLFIAHSLWKKILLPATFWQDTNKC